MPGVIRTVSADALAVVTKDLANLSAREAAAIAARDAARTAGREAAQQAAEKELRNVQASLIKKQAIKDALSKVVAKEQKEVANRTIEDSKLTKAAGKEVATADSKSWLSQNVGKVIAGVTAATLAALTLAKYIKSKETVRTITKVEDATGGDIKITFTPAIKILESDIIDISDSKTDPSIDGTGITIVSSISSSQIKITPSNALKKFESGGKINVHTSFGAQLGDTAKEAADNIGAGNFLSSIFPFLKDIPNALMISISVIIVFSCLGSSVGALFLFKD